MTDILFPSRAQRPWFYPSLGRVLLAVAALVLAIVLIIGPARLLAQIEGERGIAPIVTTGDIDVGGIEVNATGKNALEARQAGWKMAYRKAWEQLHGPDIGEGQLESLVSGVVIEHEAIGPHRYIARLGVVFDRARAGPLVRVGVNGASLDSLRHSPPMLVVPVLYAGGVGQVYEIRGSWQKAWAEFSTGASALDYVRPSGGGGDSLLITAGQVGRHSRVWWRNVLDQYGASDVIIPIARLERQWPGGPVKAYFTARYGPENRFIGEFTLTAPDEQSVPTMLADGVKRMDQLYTAALDQGLLRADTSLSLDSAAIDPALAAVISAGERQKELDAAAAEKAATAQSAIKTQIIDPILALTKPNKAPATSFTVQIATPDARAIDAGLSSLRGTSGVTSTATSSIAIGGTSVMRVTFSGNANELAAALRARGWQVSVTGGTLRIHR
ncbi:MAG: hypothetical protein RLY97_1947 [Pseudomonadota bacterium]